MAEKKSFVVYRDLDIEGMTDEQAGQLFKAMLDFANGRDASISDPEARGLWRAVRRQMQSDADAYNDMVDSRKQAGEAGAKKRWKHENGKTNFAINENGKTNFAINENGKNGKPIFEMAKMADTDTDTDTDRDTTPPTPPQGGDARAGGRAREELGRDICVLAKQEEPPGFEEFWEAYPRKQGKGAARDAWARASPDAALRGRIMAAVRVNSARNPQWLRDGGRYVPNPATWLCQSRWEDEIPEARAPTGDPANFSPLAYMLSKVAGEKGGANDQGGIGEAGHDGRGGVSGLLRAL